MPGATMGKLLCAAVLVVFLGTAQVGGVHAAQFTVSPQYDVDKYIRAGKITPIPYGVDPDDTSDTKMCWAATVSNVLMYTGWGSDVDGDGVVELYDDLYHDFLGFFPNEGGSGSKGYAYYISQHWPSVNWSDFFYQENDDRQILNRVDDWLGLGYGLYLSITDEANTFSHSLTCWGFGTDDVTGEYTQLAVTDSDDWGVGPRWYGLAFDTDKWQVTGYGAPVYISRIDAFAPSSVPLPGTMLLLGSGFIGLWGLRRKRF